MSEDDLTLLANSWVYVCLSPLVGGILAVVVYILFISELLAGDLFPHFVSDSSLQTGGVTDAANGLTAMTTNSTQTATAANQTKGLSVIFEIHGNAADYGKMMFWSFLAGFSERFATDIINRFESDAAVGDKPKADPRLPIPGPQLTGIRRMGWFVIHEFQIPSPELSP
jgi:hypothetical protein